MSSTTESYTFRIPTERGYMWRYIVDENPLPQIQPFIHKKNEPKNRVKVCQYDRFTGEKLNTFSSYTAASKACRCKLDSIRNNVMGLTNTAAGFIWRLESDNLDRVEPVPIRGGRWDRESA